MVWDITSIFPSPGKFIGWGEGSRGDSWAGAPGEQLLLLLPEPPVFPLVPPQFILASCASAVFVELSSDWLEKWFRVKITFWGWWEGHEHNWGVQQGGGTESSREVESGGSCLGCHPPSEEMPKEGSALHSHALLLPAVLQRGPSARCCVILLLLSRGLTVPAELLLELTLTVLGQNASTAESQVCANPAGSGGKHGQARGKQAVAPGQGEATSSRGQHRNSFLPTQLQLEGICEC